MIKYFTYYSFGGYKDIYVGSDSDSADASYFIPLLNVWKKSDKLESVEKLAKAESVKQVELITKSNFAGFPAECNLMFSHGGYCAIYRTLSDGRTCLCIRDIPNGTKDEEGRDIPFNFMFIADSEESIDKLDFFFFLYLTTIKETNSLIASAITYDHIINGYKFDIAKLDSLFSSDFESRTNLKHRTFYVDYLLVGSRNQISLAIKEQELNAKKVNAVFDSERLIYGRLEMVTEQSNLDDNSDDVTTVNSKVNRKFHKEIPIVESDETEKPESNQDIVHEKSVSVKHSELTNKSEDISTERSVVEEIKEEIVAHDLELKCKEIEQRLSCLASKNDFESLKSLINKLLKENNYNFDKIQSTLETLQRSTELPSIVSAQNDIPNLFKNRTYLIAIGCLIVGFVLGALIF